MAICTVDVVLMRKMRCSTWSIYVSELIYFCNRVYKIPLCCRQPLNSFTKCSFKNKNSFLHFHNSINIFVGGYK